MPNQSIPNAPGERTANRYYSSPITEPEKYHSPREMEILVNQMSSAITSDYTGLSGTPALARYLNLGYSKVRSWVNSGYYPAERHVPKIREWVKNPTVAFFDRVEERITEIGDLLALEELSEVLDMEYDHVMKSLHPNTNLDRRQINRLVRWTYPEWYRRSENGPRRKAK